MPYNRNIYTIDLEKLAHWMVPVRWRMKKLMAWVKAMAVTWTDLFNRFSLYRNRIKYNLLISPQVCYLEKALNDKYDPIDRGIVIEDAEEFFPVHLFTRAELKPVYLFRRSEDKPEYLYRRVEMAQFGVDFIIKVPSDVVFDDPEMRMYVTGYKLATKTFAIVIV